jgi:hypothetical protein
MLRIVDDGGHFDAPIEKVWGLIEVHATETGAIHPAAQNVSVKPVGENQSITSFDTEIEGHKVHVKLRVTRIPPTAQVLEFLEGPLAGSKLVNYYTPKGEKTGITVIGDFASPMLPEPALQAAARQFLDNGFSEDGVYLKKMR